MSTNSQTLLQAHRIVACAFTLLLALSTSLLKKSPILIRSASFSLVVAPCGCIVLDSDSHSPHCCRVPHPPPLARASLRVPLAPSCHARWCWWCSLRIARAAFPTDPSLVLVVLVLACAAGCWMLVVLARRHLPLALTPTPRIDRHRRPPPLCCKYMFQMF
jgi:hypothetical protein